MFTAANLEVIRSLTEDAWQIPFSTRVDASTNFQHTWADGDELIVEDLVGSGEITPEVVERARRVSLADWWRSTTRRTPNSRFSTPRWAAHESQGVHEEGEKGTPCA